MQLNLALRMSEKKEKILIKILNCLQKFAQRCESSAQRKSGHGEVMKGGDRGTSVAGDKWKWKPKTQTDIGIVTSLVNP